MRLKKIRGLASTINGIPTYKFFDKNFNVHSYQKNTIYDGYWFNRKTIGYYTHFDRIKFSI